MPHLEHDERPNPKRMIFRAVLVLRNKIFHEFRIEKSGPAQRVRRQYVFEETVQSTPQPYVIGLYKSLFRPLQDLAGKIACRQPAQDIFERGSLDLEASR